MQDFYLKPGLKQNCWAHLLRDTRDLAEKEKSPDEALEFYKGLKQIYKDACTKCSNLKKVSSYDRFNEFTTVIG